jgi:hypothetical protein
MARNRDESMIHDFAVPFGAAESTVFAEGEAAYLAKSRSAYCFDMSTCWL